MKMNEFRQICEGNPLREGIASRSQRLFSIWVSRFVSQFEWITAEMVCFSWVCSAFIGALLFYFGNYWLALLGLFIFHFGMVLDCSDGDIARFRKVYTIRGPYLDLIGHQLVNSILLLGIGFYSYQNPMFNLSPIIFLISGAVAGIMILNINMARLKLYEALSDNKIDIMNEQKRFKKLSGFSVMGQIIHPLLRIGPLSLFYFATVFNVLPVYILFIAVFYTLFYFGRIYKEFNYIKRRYD